MNLQFDGNSRDLTEVLLQHLPGGTAAKTTKNSIMIAGVAAEIRTQQVSDTNLDSYLYANSLALLLCSSGFNIFFTELILCLHSLLPFAVKKGKVVPVLN
jgi:hypothetical protein